MLVLSYIWFLNFIPFLTEKEDEEIQWHAKNGIVMMCAGIGVMLVLSFLVSWTFGGCFGLFVKFLAMLVCMGVAIVHIVAIFKALNGEKLIVPGVTQYVDKF